MERGIRPLRVVYFLNCSSSSLRVMAVGAPGVVRRRRGCGRTAIPHRFLQPAATSVFSCFPGNVLRLFSSLVFVPATLLIFSFCFLLLVSHPFTAEGLVLSQQPAAVSARSPVSFLRARNDGHRFRSRNFLGPASHWATQTTTVFFLTRFISWEKYVRAVSSSPLNTVRWLKDRLHFEGNIYRVWSIRRV